MFTLILFVVVMMCASEGTNRAMSACMIATAGQHHKHSRVLTSTTTSLSAKLGRTDRTKKRGSENTRSLKRPPGQAASGGGFAKRKKMNNKRSRSDDSDESGRLVKNNIDSRGGSGDTKRKGLVQISTSPALFIFDDFMDPDECRHLTQETSDAFCLSFRDKVYSQLLGGHRQSAMDGMKFNYASSRDANNDASERTTFPDGLHLDTNNGCMFRHLTAILYLNDVSVEHGGSTMFPLAGIQDDHHPVMAASRRLLEAKICHTRSCGTVRKSGVEREADAAMLEDMTNYGHGDDNVGGTAIRVQPQAGRLLLFFSRMPQTGAEDPRSWHGGERLIDKTSNSKRNHGSSSVTEKRILTIFKQVDYGLVEPTLAASTLETYLSHEIQTQTQLLLDCCR